MPVQIAFHVDPSPKQIARELGSLSRSFSDWKPAWRALLPILADEMRATLEGEGVPIGARWPELDPETLKRRTRAGIRGQGRMALQSTGRLLATVSSPSAGLRRMTGTQLRFGPNERYQFVQHFGSKRRGIPARPFIGWTPRGERAAIDAMDQRARALLDRAAQLAFSGGQ